MKNKKTQEQIDRIKSLIYEQETKEGLASDIKNYLIDKVEGVISGTKLGDAFDSLLNSFGSDSTEKLKTALDVPDTPANQMNRNQRIGVFSKIKNDDEVYAHILWGLNLPVTSHNINFLKLWRIAENGTETSSGKERRPKNNPFNTTWDFSSLDPNQTTYNYANVRNYSTIDIGVESTITTLKSSRYKCIVDGLRNQLPYDQIANCRTGNSEKPAMYYWGTTSADPEHFNKIIKQYKGKSLDPHKIVRESNN